MKHLLLFLLGLALLCAFNVYIDAPIWWCIVSGGAYGLLARFPLRVELQ